MNDPRLEALDAREYFESCVLHHLLAGWQPGNEILFNVAVDVFHWKQDRHSLDRFEAAGTRMETAIMEQMVFNAKHPDLRHKWMAALRALRHDNSDADLSKLVFEHIADLQYMAEHFPTLSPLITNNKEMQRWIDYANKVRHAIPPHYASIKISQSDSIQQNELSFRKQPGRGAHKWAPLLIVSYVLMMVCAWHFGAGRAVPADGQRESKPPSTSTPYLPTSSSLPSFSSTSNNATLPSWPNTSHVLEQNQRSLDLLAVSAANPNNCLQLETFAHDYGMGTEAPRLLFGPHVASKVRECIKARRWHFQNPIDYAVNQAFKKDARERANP